jgi:hypothetical protein
MNKKPAWIGEIETLAHAHTEMFEEAQLVMDRLFAGRDGELMALYAQRAAGMTEQQRLESMLRVVGLGFLVRLGMRLPDARLRHHDAYEKLHADFAQWLGETYALDSTRAERVTRDTEGRLLNLFQTVLRSGNNSL